MCVGKDVETETCVLCMGRELENSTEPALELNYNYHTIQQSHFGLQIPGTKTRILTIYLHAYHSIAHDG